MLRKLITEDDLVIQDELEADAKKFHNKVLKVNKRSRLATWYYKVKLDYTEAVREVVAQELFRLFIPNQIKTRLVEPLGEGFGVISKQVEGCESLADMDADDLINSIESDEYYGIGEILVISLLLDEIDLKLDNLCLDNNNQVIKIDGGCSFTTLSSVDGEYEYFSGEVTAADIQRLPFLATYTPVNWLDYYRMRAPINQSAPITNACAASAAVRAEINRALLKVLLIPSEVIIQVINSYVANQHERQIEIDQLIARKKIISDAALKTDFFRDYLLTNDAVKDLEEYIHYICDFKTTGKNGLTLTADGDYMKRQLTRNRNIVRVQNSKMLHGLFRSVKGQTQERDEQCNGKDLATPIYTSRVN